MSYKNQKQNSKVKTPRTDEQLLKHLTNNINEISHQVVNQASENKGTVSINYFRGYVSQILDAEQFTGYELRQIVSCIFNNIQTPTMNFDLMQIIVTGAIIQNNYSVLFSPPNGKYGQYKPQISPKTRRPKRNSILPPPPTKGIKVEEPQSLPLLQLQLQVAPQLPAIDPQTCDSTSSINSNHDLYNATFCLDFPGRDTTEDDNHNDNLDICLSVFDHEDFRLL